MKLLSVLVGLFLAVNAQAGTTLVGDLVDAGMYRTIDTGRGVGRIVGFGLDQPFMVEEGAADTKNIASRIPSTSTAAASPSTFSIPSHGAAGSYFASAIWTFPMAACSSRWSSIPICPAMP
ncbi:hypothetical protein LP420_32185 [Massilia sp. B-10]|nr:hypothetical protein LP420_32185 [Massilia sp. B-10]